MSPDDDEAPGGWLRPAALPVNDRNPLARFGPGLMSELVQCRPPWSPTSRAIFPTTSSAELAMTAAWRVCERYGAREAVAVRERRTTRGRPSTAGLWQGFVIDLGRILADHAYPPDYRFPATEIGRRRRVARDLEALCRAVALAWNSAAKHANVYRPPGVALTLIALPSGWRRQAGVDGRRNAQARSRWREAVTETLRVIASQHDARFTAPVTRDSQPDN